MSPGEADAQLAAFIRADIVQIVFSNDSDEHVLGCGLVAQFQNHVDTIYDLYITPHNKQFSFDIL